MIGAKSRHGGIRGRANRTKESTMTRWIMGASLALALAGCAGTPQPGDSPDAMRSCAGDAPLGSNINVRRCAGAEPARKLSALQAAHAA
jgi:hypothetical protein